MVSYHCGEDTVYGTMGGKIPTLEKWTISIINIEMDKMTRKI